MAAGFTSLSRLQELPYGGLSIESGVENASSPSAFTQKSVSPMPVRNANFVCNALHTIAVEPSRFGEDPELIAVEGAIGEDVQVHVFALHNASMPPAVASKPSTSACTCCCCVRALLMVARSM